MTTLSREWGPLPPRRTVVRHRGGSSEEGQGEAVETEEPSSSNTLAADFPQQSAEAQYLQCRAWGLGQGRALTMGPGP